MQTLTFEFEKENHTILRGKMYKAEGEDKQPLVIFSHGFGGCYADLEHHGIGFAEKGIHCFFIDFCGGGLRSTSDGDMREMSVYTEVSDLEFVINELGKLPYVDEQKIFLVGESQGGLVSALTAARNKELIKALCLWYPAFCIPDDARRYFPDGKVEERLQFGLPVGKKYSEAIIDMDVFEEIEGYERPVFIIHGDKDSVVNYSYSEKALTVYKDAELYKMVGSDHGFQGSDSDLARKMTVEFVCKHM